MTTNFFTCIYERLQQHLDDELIVWPEPNHTVRSHTGRDILNRISVLRRELTDAGLQPGQSILLAMPVSFDLICSLLAIMALGAIPMLPPATATPRTLLLLTIRSKMSGLLTRQKMAWPTRSLLRAFSITPVCTEGISVSRSDWLPPHPVDPDQPALVSHSSGSTGRAKAIRRSHQVLQAQHLALSEAFPPWAGQRDFPLFPNVLLHNLATGTVSILPDLPGFQLTKTDPSQISQQITNQRIDTLTGNVFYFQKLLAYCHTHSLTFPAVRAVGVGGSPVPDKLAQALKRVFRQASVYIIYGSSEAEPIAIRDVGAEFFPPSFGYEVGTIHPAIQVQIRAMGRLTFADGTYQTAGEIGVRGAHVATLPTGWLWTGDFGYIDDQNRLFLTGRKGNEQIHQGVQHYQIEHVLTSVAGVERVAARATNSGFTVYVEGSPADLDVREALADNFPAGLVTQLVFTESLPVDTRHQSKIRYDELR